MILDKFAKILAKIYSFDVLKGLSYFTLSILYIEPGKKGKETSNNMNFQP